MPRVQVLLPVPLRDAFDYLANDALPPGQIVLVPFGKRAMTGVVEGPATGNLPIEKLKAITEVIPNPLPEALIKFVRWVANYTLTPPGMVLKMVFGGAELPKRAAPELGFRKTSATPEGKLTPAAQKVLAMLEQTVEPMGQKELRAKAGCTASVIATLVKKGLIERAAMAAPMPPQPNPDFAVPELSAAQDKAAATLLEAVAAHKHQVLLLDGVTGSGKTEVFCEAIAATLRAGRQVCVLMPEIALTTSMVERFEKRFGAKPVIWHSAVGTRHRQWWDIFQGRSKLVIGARSALFLPYADLGLIVIDEEHDQSYKQEEVVIYNARDMAVVRGKLEGIPVVLSSATPSLESYLNGQQGKYVRLELPDRYGGAKLPTVELIDIRKEKIKSQHWLSAQIVKELKENIANKQQAMLFLNRRGYAPLTLCRACGHRLQCPNCTAWMVQHKTGNRLMCHHCGTHCDLPKKCPKCEAEDRFAACGPGVERIADEVKELLPDARVAIMASDITSTPKEMLAALDKVKRHEIDLLIGTQIVAKGHHFPDLSLVGVVDADLGLGGGDPRAAERTFQLLHQVAGRSGRGEYPGRVLVQTTQPDHPVMKALAANDRAGFLAAEAKERENYKLPPFVRLAGIVVSGSDAGAVDRWTQTLADEAPTAPGVQILGPSPAPLARLRGKHRRRLLLRVDKTVNIQAVLRDWLTHTQLPRSIRLTIDVDPYSFM